MALSTATKFDVVANKSEVSSTVTLETFGKAQLHN